jgi:hypothetical protein
LPILVPWMIFLPLLIVWLSLCIVLALLGIILPRRPSPVQLDFVRESQTVCKILNHKGLISDDEYYFEHEIVAPRYSQAVFSGYLFIVGPVRGFLKNFYFLDSFFVFLVKRWMGVQHYFLKQNQRPPTWQLLVTQLALFIADGVGRVVLLFTNEDNDE